MSLENCEARAGQLAWDLIVFGRPISNEELIEKIEIISQADVQAVGRRFREAPGMVSAVIGARGASSVVSDAAEAFHSGTPAAA
jgi:predicted Zn-dependent peptidase